MTVGRVPGTFVPSSLKMTNLCSIVWVVDLFDFERRRYRAASAQSLSVILGNINAAWVSKWIDGRVPRWMRTSSSIRRGASMFEDSLFASRVGVVSATKRWTVAASVAVQMALAGVVITLPLLHPEALPMHVDAPKVLMPVVPKPPVPVVVTEHVAPASTLSLPSAPSLPRPAIPTMLPGADTSASDVPGISSINIGMSDGASLPPGIGTGVGHGPDVSVAPARQSGAQSNCS